MKEKILHRFISFTMPFLFINTFIVLLSCLLQNFGISLNFHWAFRISILALVGIFNIVISSILYIERVGFSGRIRTAILSLIVMYLITIPFNSNPWPYKFAPLPEQWLVMFFVILECLLISYFQSKYIGREQFLEFTADLSGKELYKTMRDTGGLTKDAAESIQKTKLPCNLFLAIILVFHFIFLIAKLHVSLEGYICTIIFCIFWLFSNEVIKFSNDEQYYAGLGIGKIFSFFYKRLFYVLFFGVICFCFAFSLSQNKAILPASILQALWAWLASLNKPITVTQEPQLPQNESNYNYTLDMAELLGPIDESEKADLTWLFVFVRYTFIIALVCVFLIFLFSVFFKKDFKNFIKQGKLYKLFRHFFLSLKEIIKGFLLAKKEKTQKVTKSKATEDFTNLIKNKIKQKQSIKKQEEIGRLSNYFVKLILWGESFKINWNATMAPKEYTDHLFSEITILNNSKMIFLLNNDFEKLQNYLQITGILFEQSLYAKELLTKDEENQFILAINKCINTTISIKEDSTEDANNV